MERLELVQADITTEEVDAIVNAANSRLANGGGVARAIRLAAGPDFQIECDMIGTGRGCPTGTALTTGAYELPCKRVIHTVGPIWGAHAGAEPELLASAYRSAIDLAGEQDLRTISFPSISTGIYGYPIGQAAPIALREIRAGLERHSRIELVRMCLFSDEDLRVYREALERR